MKNKVFYYKTDVFGLQRVPESVRNLIDGNNGIQLVRGNIRLDKTHNLGEDETALVILSRRKDDSHSLVICSQGGFFDDVKVWSGEDIKSLQAAVEALQDTKQNITEETLSTQTKSIAGAINEIFGGGVKDKSINASKLAQAVQDTLGMVGTNVKVLPAKTSLTSQTLEDGIWIVLPNGNNHNPPSWLYGYHIALLVVNQSNDSVMILGVDGSKERLPAFAVRRYNSTNWEGSMLLSGAAGGVKTANIEDGAVTFTKLADDSVIDSKIVDGSVTESKIAPRAVTEDKIVDGSVTENKLGARILHAINGAAQKVFVSTALEVIELTDNNTQNKAAIDARIAKLTELGVDITNGYSIPISYISGNKEYHGMVTAGKNSLLNGIVSDAQGGSYFGISVGATDGIVTFEEGDPLVFKSEMSSAIDTLVECVEFTKTTLSNKAHLDAYLAKLPNAKVMCCTYNGGYAGTLHKINGSWYGVLVSESNTLAGQLSIKLQSDGTIVEGTA